MKLRKELLYGIGTVLLLYVLIFGVSVRIDRTVDAVEIALDDHSFCQPIEVTIDGAYKWRLLGADTFRGNISFDAYELTMENPLEQGDNVPALRQQDGGDFLDYGEWMESQVFGFISWKPFLSKFVVQVYVPHESGVSSCNTEDGHCIVGPATSRDDALKVLRAFSNIHLPPYEYWLEEPPRR